MSSLTHAYEMPRALLLVDSYTCVRVWLISAFINKYRRSNLKCSLRALVARAEPVHQASSLLRALDAALDLQVDCVSMCLFRVLTFPNATPLQYRVRQCGRACARLFPLFS